MKAVKPRLVNVAVFAMAMAWMEAAVVLYLRVLVNRLQPYQPDPLPRFGGLGQAELIREGATLLMLLAIGWLAGDRTRTRFAFSAFAFGVWDIFYYLFLIPLTGWPHSLLDWDLLFLIPLPWWGPVIAPVAISLLLVTGGVLAVLLDRKEQPACRSVWSVWIALGGTGMILYAFMADAIHASGRGLARAWEVLPANFQWSLFWLGLLLLAVPVADMAGRILFGNRIRAGKR
jgi:hypothetical protein